VPLEPEQTLHDLVHEVVSLVVFLAFGFAPLVAGVSLLRSAPRWSAYSLLSGTMALAFFAATVYGSMEADRGTPIGILQRISIVAGLGWVSAYLVRELIRLPEGDAGSTTASTATPPPGR